MNASADIGTKAGSQKEYSIFLTDMGISYSVNGSFLVSGTPSFDGRWLICLSICLRDTEQILAKVLPVLKEYNVPFMLIKDQLQHNRINCHAFPVQLFGKSLIVFPEDTNQAIRLVENLISVTDAFDGVVVPGCIRLGSIVYAVYAQLNPGYKEDDTDQLPFVLDIPSAEQVPFPDQMKWKEKKIKRFIKRRYLPISLIRSSHKGNILKALDLWRMKWCFVKQAKAWAAEDYYGREMRDRLLWQMEVSTAVDNTVRTPKMLDFAGQDGYSYLISEYLEGKTFDQIINETPNTPDDLFNLLGYFPDILIQVRNLHAAGYAHRDLTTKNVLIKDNQTYLTDFELAHFLEDELTPAYISGSVGYMSPEQRHNEHPSTAEDIYSLGAMLYYMVGREHPRQIAQQPDRKAKIKTLNAPEIIKDLILQSMADDPKDRLKLEELYQPLMTLLDDHRILAERKTFCLRHKDTKQKLAISMLLMLLACATVIVMWLISDEPNSHLNGFTRNFLSENMMPIYKASLSKDTRYLAGIVDDSLYFSTGTPGEVSTLHIPSRKIKKRMLVTDPNILHRLDKSGILQADQFGIALFDGNAHLFILDRPQSGLEIYQIPELFTRAVRFSENSIALRKFKAGEPDQYLYRYDLAQRKALDESRVTEAAQDGGLVTGGLLDFDNQTGQGVYVTRYANHVTLIDTNMRILSSGRTIDTTSQYTLGSQVVSNGKGAEITNGGPAKYVNMAITLHQGYLYVNSYLKADNETAEQFINSNVIDVYKISGLKYMGSYRLPVSDKQRIHNFKVQDAKLYVIYPGMLRIYELPNQPVSLKSAGL